MLPWSLLDPQYKAPNPSHIGGCSPLPVRYARWDGGPIEVVKAYLTGWHYMKDPLAAEATCKWYDGDNSLDLLRQAEINWIWVTFSAGFSTRTERRQWEVLEPFIEKCHDHGIGVTAYMSLCNIFIEDMRAEHPDLDDWMQRESDGGPVAYGADRRSADRRRKRVLGCMSAEPWQGYILERVDAALERRMDGIMYDNMFADCRCPRCAEQWTAFTRDHFGQPWPWPDDDKAMARFDLQEKRRVELAHSAFRTYLLSKAYELIRQRIDQTNPRVLLYANFNTLYNCFAMPATTAISTENLFEPGVVNGKVRTNIGMLRSLVGASAGFRPVRTEFGQGRLFDPDRPLRDDKVGGRYAPMSPAHQQLSLAEAHSHGVSRELCPEGQFLRDLFFRVPYAMQAWEAIATYHRFFARHSDLYEDVRTAANMVVVTNSGFDRIRNDEFAQRRWFLVEMADRGVFFDVVFDNDLCRTDDPDRALDRYDVMLLPDTCVFDDTLTEVVAAFARRGGQVIATGDTGRYDPTFRPRSESVLQGLPNVEWLDDPAAVASGQEDHAIDGVEPWPDSLEKSFSHEAADRLATHLRPLVRTPINVDAPSTVRYNLTRDARGRLLLHLLNYADVSCDAVTITGDFDTESVELFSPDDPGPKTAKLDQSALAVTNIVRYTVVRMGIGSR